MSLESLTCPVCMALKALAEVHELELGRGEAIGYRPPASADLYPFISGVLAGTLERIARDSRRCCRKHTIGRGRADLDQLFVGRRSELQQRNDAALETMLPPRKGLLP